MENSKIKAPPNTPEVLLAWAVQASADEIVITRVRTEFETQGERSMQGDWFIEFDGQIGYLWRQLNSRYFVSVTHNAGGYEPEFLEVEAK